MTQVDIQEEITEFHPLDVAEQVVIANGWHFVRRTDDEIAAEVRGKWCDFSLHFAWSRDASAIHYTCAFDMRVPTGMQSAVNDLLAVVNDKMWLGHFGVWNLEAIPMFRHTILLRGARESVTVEQMEDLLDVSVAECERFYPAFQFVVWGGKSPEEAVEAAILDTVGEA